MIMIIIMEKILLITLLLISVFIAGCSTSITSETNQENSKPLILTTFYPVEEITKAIVKNTANVEVLIKTGVEPHSFEPTPTQIVKLSKSDVFVTMEGMFKHVEEEIIDTNLNIKIIHSTHNIELIKEDEHDDHHDSHGHEEHESHDEHSHGEYDPHVWLSIHNMESMTNEILEHLIEFYPENKKTYESNAQTYLEQLEQLEIEFETKLSSCEHNEIIVNHKAFGYLGHEYNFEQISVTGFSPESEPSPKTIQNVIDEAKEHNLNVVFTEGQLDTKTAQTIANDISGQVLELNPIKLNDNETYFSIMRNNLNNLAIGLNCLN